MDTSSTDYTVRRFCAADGQGVVDCVRRIYGDSYIVHTELYHPDQIVALNEDGRLVSVVALDSNNEIVGHYALERPDLRLRIAESGEAMVLPEHQHHHVLEKMRVLLENEAARLGLTGVFGRTVTNHVFSQKMVERFGERPCGVSLGEVPRTFHNMAQALSQRMSSVFYFKYLAAVDVVRIHVPPRHHDVCRQIYEQFQVRIDAGPAQLVPDSGEFAVAHHTELKQASILVRRVGKDTVAQVRGAHRELCDGEQVEVVYLELPLTEAGTPVLRLQFLNVELDTSILQIESPFAQRLLRYVDQERQRVHGG
jgi:hypothetical protein